MPRRLIRLAAVVGVLASILMPLPGSSAAPKCPLISDPSGDATAPPGVSSGANFLFPNEPAYDIVSADIASDRSVITVVIRVLKLATQAPSAPMGIEWRFDFTAGQNMLFAEAISAASSRTRKAGVSAYIGYVDNTSHLITSTKVLLDFRRSEVRIRVPISDFGAYAPSLGTKLTNLVATAGRWYEGPKFTYSETVDRDTTDNVYVLGSKGCIHP